MNAQTCQMSKVSKIQEGKYIHTFKCTVLWSNCPKVKRERERERDLVAKPNQESSSNHFGLRVFGYQVIICFMTADAAAANASVVTSQMGVMKIASKNDSLRKKSIVTVLLAAAADSQISAERRRKIGLE